MSTILSCQNLIKMYGEQEVLKGVSLDINSGDFMAVVGQSGSGKSTLLYLLSGLEKPTNGEVLLEGKSILNLKDKEVSQLRLHKYGFVFQFYNLIENLTVAENIMYPLMMDKKIKKEEAKKMVQEVAEKVNLADKLKKYPFQLSGGEQQRVSIARAIITSPSIIFADEPTGNLDSKMGLEVMDLLSSINKEYNTTIIMVTHNDSLNNYFNRIVTIKDGKIYE